MENKRVARRRLKQLLAAVDKARHVLILPHNDPDPDAIAGALGLAYLLQETAEISSRVAYKGIIGRAENRALVRYLGHPLQRFRLADLQPGMSVALVDTHPGMGNHPLPAGTPVTLVLDHHVWNEETPAAAFADVRSDVGAVSTMVAEYLQVAGLQLPTPLATALFYGIKTDTMGLGRGANPADAKAYFYLLPLIDPEALVKIERAQVPADYFKSLAATVQTARVYNGVVIAYIGSAGYPDLPAEMADLLLRLQGIQWVVCLGVYKETMVVSIRTHHNRGGARQLARAIVGDDGLAGGHGMLAGGQISLDGQNADRLAAQLRRRALDHLKITETEGKPLV